MCRNAFGVDPVAIASRRDIQRREPKSRCRNGVRPTKRFELNIRLKIMRRVLVSIVLVTVALAVAAAATWRGNVRAVRDAWIATSSYGTFGVVEHVRAVPAYLQGRREAQRDLRRGCLRLKTWGLPAPWRSIYIELADKRLGVTTCVTAGCVIDPISEASWVGYNEVMQREIDRRYGKDALEKLSQQADDVFKQRYERGELPRQVAANQGRIVPPNNALPHWKD